MAHPLLFWIGFHLLIALLLAVDLGFFHRTGQRVKFKKACLLSAFWVAVALAFNYFVYVYFGSESALQFFTGYLIEKSLSVDNLFLFLLIFQHFQTPVTHQYKVLFWGILGALIFRISLILAGISLIEQFHWMFYVFGAFLLFSGIKFMLQKQKIKDPSQGFLFRVLSRFIPMTKAESQGRFFVSERGKWKVTTLFLALLMIECTDILFALDSIPAVFAITTDPFLVYTSNVFAILGLRALYFVLSTLLSKLKYLKIGLAAILIFVGLKMLLSQVVPVSAAVSLAVIAGILGVTALLSLQRKKFSS